MWIHKRCSGKSGQLQGISNSRCRCYVSGEPININVDNENFEFVLGDRVDLVERFCYLGDMIGAGVEAAMRARVRCAWAKFRELSPILTARGASLKVRGKVYRACAQIVMMYGSKTWAVEVEDERKLESRENDDQVNVRNKTGG